MDSIVRVRTIAFTPDRAPTLRRIRLGYEGDNLVERLEFELPEIAAGQTATLMITGADAVKLERTDEDRYAVDLTRDMIGPDGEREAYVRIDGTGERVWQSTPMRLITGALPDVEEEIDRVYPTAVGQMLTAMAEHSSEMNAQEERVEQAAQRAEEAAERAEAGGGGCGSGAPGKDGGYYQPSVTDGVLTWTPSKADMPSVPASDVRGPAGKDGQPGKDGAPGKTAYQYAQDGGYMGTEEEFAAKLAEELPEPYTLPVATADTLGGVKVGSDFAGDGNELKINRNLELLVSYEIAEGEEPNKMEWIFNEKTEVEVFVTFPAHADKTRITGRVGAVNFYIAGGFSETQEQYVYLRWARGRGRFTYYGLLGMREGYAEPIPTLGLQLKGASEATPPIVQFNARTIPYPAGTKVVIYGK